MLCSTDASAVLAVLRPLADRLPGRLIDLIDCESAFNDPMAVVLAGVALALSAGQTTDGATLISDMVRQFLMGTMVGFLGEAWPAVCSTPIPKALIPPARPWSACRCCCCSSAAPP